MSDYKNINRCENKIRPAIIFAIYLLAAFITAPAPVFPFASAYAQAPLPAREINLQNIALNKCEQYIKANKIELAAKSFEEAGSYPRAIEHNPNYPKIKELFEKKKKEYIKELTERGNQLFLEKKYEDSKKIFSKVITIEPGNLQALDKLEVCDEQLKILERKREVYHSPSLDIKTIEKWDVERLKEISARALKMINQKNFKAALELFTECKSKDPNNPYFEDKIKAVELFIKIQTLSNDFTKKISANPGDISCAALLSKLEKEDKDFNLRRYALDEINFVNHMISIAGFYLFNKRHDEAESILKLSLGFTGASDKVLFLLAKIYYERHDYAQSYHAIKTLKYKEDLNAEFKPQVRGYYYELIFRLYKLLISVTFLQLAAFLMIAYRSYEVIDYAFEGVITRFFTFRMYDSKYYYERGMIQYNRANYPRAIIEIAKSLSLDKSNVSAYQTLGLCYYKSGVYDQARLSLETVMKMSPNNQRAAYYLALVYDYMKMPKEAIRMLEMARGITLANRGFTMLEIEKNKRLYIGTFQDYKLSADKILNLNEPILT
jgi:predicted Zn-dependent protease